MTFSMSCGLHKYKLNALQRYTEALLLAPNLPVLRVNRALNYLRKGELRLAAEDCRHALKLEPSYLKVLAALRVVTQDVASRIGQGGRCAASECVRCRADWSCCAAQAHFFLGQALLELGEAELLAAIPHLSKARPS